MPSLVAFIPHPDDEAYAFAGTIALAAAARWQCTVFCATRGEGGERHDRGPGDPARLGADREQELRRSCAILGAEPPEMWGLPDGALASAPSQAGRIWRLLQARRPEIVLSLGPDGAYGHPDHLALHDWVADAWRDLDEPRPALLFAAFPRGLFLPHYEKCLASGIMGDPPLLARQDIGLESSHYEVDIASVRDRKLASIGAHRSQLPLGDARRLFPAGIVDALFDVERYVDASGGANPEVAAVLAGWSEGYRRL